jgi:hypothetical protein
LKLALEATQGCAWIYVGRSVCKRQGFKLKLTTKTLIQRLFMVKQHVLAYIPNHFTVSLHFLAVIFIFISNITQFGALAGQIKHKTAQEVEFMPQPIRHKPLNWQL